MATNTDGRGKSAQLEQEIQQLKRAQTIKDRELNSLRNQVSKQKTKALVWSNKFMNFFDDKSKSEFIEQNRANLKALFRFSNERYRKVKKELYGAVVTQSKDSFEQWMRNKTNDEWQLCELTLVEYVEGGSGPKHSVPDEDSLNITFTHDGLIYSKIGDPRNVSQGVTPKPAAIMTTVRFLRYEIGL